MLNENLNPIWHICIPFSIYCWQGEGGGHVAGACVVVVVGVDSVEGNVWITELLNINSTSKTVIANWKQSAMWNLGNHAYKEHLPGVLNTPGWISSTVIYTTWPVLLKGWGAVTELCPSCIKPTAGLFARWEAECVLMTSSWIIGWIALGNL